MKKILFLLLFSCFAFGQNIELLKKINQLDSISTLELTHKVFPEFQIEPFTKYDSIDYKHSQKLIYRLTNSKGDKVGIVFQKQIQGGNPDLKISGKSYFVFENATANFLDIYPFWKKEIQPDATTDKTYESRPVYTYKDSENKIWLNFWKIQSGWMLRNESWRFH